VPVFLLKNFVYWVFIYQKTHFILMYFSNFSDYMIMSFIHWALLPNSNYHKRNAFRGIK